MSAKAEPTKSRRRGKLSNVPKNTLDRKTGIPGNGQRSIEDLSSEELNNQLNIIEIRRDECKQVRTALDERIESLGIARAQIRGLLEIKSRSIPAEASKPETPK